MQQSLAWLKLVCLNWKFEYVSLILLEKVGREVSTKAFSTGPSTWQLFDLQILVLYLAGGFIVNLRDQVFISYWSSWKKVF